MLIAKETPTSLLIFEANEMNSFFQVRSADKKLKGVQDISVLHIDFTRLNSSVSFITKSRAHFSSIDPAFIFGQ
jgi:hypothetical protein